MDVGRLGLKTFTLAHGCFKRFDLVLADFAYLADYPGFKSQIDWLHRAQINDGIPDQVEADMEYVDSANDTATVPSLKSKLTSGVCVPRYGSRRTAYWSGNSHF